MKARRATTRKRAGSSERRRAAQGATAPLGVGARTTPASTSGPGPRGRSRPAQAGRDRGRRSWRRPASAGRCCSSGTRRRCRSRSTSSSSTIPRCARCISASGSSSPISPIRSASPRRATGFRRRTGSSRWPPRSAARTCSCSIAISSTRPGQPTTIDFFTAIAGMLLLLEATRRVVGPPLAIIAVLMLVYAFAGPVDARRDPAQGHLAVEGRLALLAVDRRRLRRRGRRVGELHLPVRAVRLAAGEGRRRQLFHQGRVRVPRPHARRPRQGRRRVVGDDGDDLRVVGRQRRHLRHVHDPADEARRLHGGKGRRDRDARPASTARSCRR